MGVAKIREAHSCVESEIKRKLIEFSRVKGEDIFYEMCFCILTPGSRAHSCWDSVLRLKGKDFLNSNLKREEISGSLNGVRFHNNKSRYLLSMKEKYDEIYDELYNLLNDRTDSKLLDRNDRGLSGGAFAMREWLVRNVKGLGYKEASHFLRNIGFRGLAILDRHVLKNLKDVGVIREMPKTLTRKKYLEVEEKFMNFAVEIGVDVDELDLVFWSMETGEVFK